VKIISIDFYITDLALTRPYTIAYKTVSKVESVVAMIKLENGLTGIGTANPSKQVVGEDAQETIQVLNQWDKDQLLHQDIRGFYHCLHLIHHSLESHVGAQAALDIALHDVFTKWLHIPLARFLGQKIRSLPTSITIGIKNVEETLAEAKEYVDRGFSFLKIKLGRSLAEDTERLKKLREKFGQKIHIRIDANQGYTENEILQLYNQTRSLDLELIEQPLSVKETHKFRLLPLNIRQMIAADESLVNEADALMLASHPTACGIFNIKLMKSGGIYPARKIADIAKTARIDLMWGCNDESMIGIAAALHTALSYPNTRYLDLDGSFDLAKDVVSDAFILNEGEMTITDRPGLGYLNVPIE
jgi:L-alanine-DL-glutamate epimerase-like enolase superfamily enzyme